MNKRKSNEERDRILSGQTFSMADVRETFKGKDAWWTVLLVDPLASRLTWVVANYTRITPNQISLVSFVLGMIAAYNFYVGSASALIIGAIFYHISFILDCIDGKVARLKGTGSMFGVLLDIMLDHIRVVICAIALTVGQFQRTGDVTFFYLAFLFIGAYFFRHYNALMIYKLRRQMRGTIRKLRRQREREQSLAFRAQQLHITDWLDPEDVPPSTYSVISVEKAVPPKNVTDETVPSPPPKTDLQREFKSKFGWYLSIRDALLKRRIRMHLFSGIEFQMFVFIIAPIVGLIQEMIIGGAVLLLMFEFAILYKLWLSMKDYNRELSQLE